MDYALVVYLQSISVLKRHGILCSFRHHSERVTSNLKCDSNTFLQHGKLIQGQTRNTTKIYRHHTQQHTKWNSYLLATGSTASEHGGPSTPNSPL